MRAAVVGLLLLTACSARVSIESSPTSTTVPATTAITRPLDVLQVAGAWSVSEAGASALFPVGTRITFAGDGSFSADSRTGTWRVRGGELDLVVGPTMYGYTATAAPRELHLGIGPVAMTLVRA